jgi:hypothetical protein
MSFLNPYLFTALSRFYSALQFGLWIQAVRYLVTSNAKKRNEEDC